MPRIEGAPSLRLRYAARVRLLSPNGREYIGRPHRPDAYKTKRPRTFIRGLSFFCAGEGDASTLPEASTLYTDSSAWFSVALGRITAKVFSRSGR